MESDLIIKEFFSWKCGNDEDLQSYLNGENPWKTPINKDDIYYIGYSVTNTKSSYIDRGISGILLIHKIPIIP